jgi:N-carbamoylputrescine amidase
MFDEQRYFGNGARIRAFASRLAPMSMLICEDIWHPSAPIIAAHDGAQVLIVIANSPARGPQDSAWDTEAAYNAMLKTYAELLCCYVVFVNRVGFEDGVHFWGGSRILAPDGTEAVRGATGEEALVDGELDMNAVRSARVATPLLADENLDLTIRELTRIRDERTGH